MARTNDTGALYRARDWCILVQRPMRSHTVDGVDAICGQADLIRRSRAADAAQRAALAAWCAAEPGPIVVADRKRGSRFCGAALHAAPRPGHGPSRFPIQYSNSRET